MPPDARLRVVGTRVPTTRVVGTRVFDRKNKCNKATSECRCSSFVCIPEQVIPGEEQGANKRSIFLKFRCFCRVSTAVVGGELQGS